MLVSPMLYNPFVASIHRSGLICFKAAQSLLVQASMNASIELSSTCQITCLM
jgi:hypothetical protein